MFLLGGGEWDERRRPFRELFGDVVGWVCFGCPPTPPLRHLYCARAAVPDLVCVHVVGVINVSIFVGWSNQYVIIIKIKEKCTRRISLEIFTWEVINKSTFCCPERRAQSAVAIARRRNCIVSSEDLPGATNKRVGGRISGKANDGDRGSRAAPVGR